MAVVDAFDQSEVTEDLATYRSEFGLGKAHFVKYNEEGQRKDYPSDCADTAGTYIWCLTEDNDVELISATCPKCTIYLVEATTGSMTDLEAAVAEAVKLGAHVVNMSWGCKGLTCADQKDFDDPGVTYVATELDVPGGPSGFGTVVSVGPTQLVKTGSTYSETISSSAIGFCEFDTGQGIKKPSWQSVIPDGICDYRMTNDVAAEGGCPGVSDYSTFADYGGWFLLCGTAVATPLISGIYGLAGNANHQHGGRAFWLASNRKNLYRIGGICSNGYMLASYSTCTGCGSPKGLGAF